MCFRPHRRSADTRRPARLRRGALAAAMTAAALAAASLVSAPLASADQTPAPTPTPAAERAVMGDYDLEQYSAQAAATPPGLAAALRADLGIMPEQFYAQADAAATAAQVVDSLAASGVEVLSSRLDGTRLIVAVASDADAAAVEAAGATAELGGAPEPASVDLPDARYLRDLVGGQGYYNHKGKYDYFCSVGFNGIDTASKAAQFLTAGHCVTPQAEYQGRVFSLDQGYPGQTPIAAGAHLGSPIASSLRLSGGYDTALYATAGSWNPVPSVGTWSQNVGPIAGGELVPVRDYARPIVGQGVCKSGRTTGWTCGAISAVDVDSTVGEDHVNAFISNFCALGGDSGGSVISGEYALGVVSFGNYRTSCWDADRHTGSFPIDSAASTDALDVQTGWEPLVDLAPPSSAVLDGGAPLYLGSPVTGTVAGGGPRHTVHLSIDGEAEKEIPVSGGTWTAPGTEALAAGGHSFRMSVSYRSGIQISAEVEGTFVVAERPAVDRIGGATRFDMAVEVARTAFPGTAPVVYVATGVNYPDALSAGPAAVLNGGPLLPVLPDVVPGVVADEIVALDPDRIVIVGGPAAVGEPVRALLQKLVPDARVDRVSGEDRYAASRAVVADAFGTAGTAGAPAPHAFVATGTNFPDALSAGAAAGAAGDPVLLVYGPAAAADAPTVSLLQSLQTGSVTVAGGPQGVSPGVLDSISSGVPAAVERLEGEDRYRTSLAVNDASFESADTVYLATGLNFPDALAGGVLAGLDDAPLYVVPDDCVPRGVLASITELGARDVVLLGGPSALKPTVEQLQPCGF